MHSAPDDASGDPEEGRAPTRTLFYGLFPRVPDEPDHDDEPRRDVLTLMHGDSGSRDEGWRERPD